MGRRNFFAPPLHQPFAFAKLRIIRFVAGIAKHLLVCVIVTRCSFGGVPREMNVRKQRIGIIIIFWRINCKGRARRFLNLYPPTMRYFLILVKFVFDLSNDKIRFAKRWNL